MWESLPASFGPDYHVFPCERGLSQIIHVIPAKEYPAKLFVSYHELVVGTDLMFLICLAISVESISGGDTEHEDNKPKLLLSFCLS